VAAGLKASTEVWGSRVSRALSEMSCTIRKSPQHSARRCKSFVFRGVDTERRGVCHALYLTIKARVSF
jgi:hypothetical protein